jgi:hypothetical protein
LYYLGSLPTINIDQGGLLYAGKLYYHTLSV